MSADETTRLRALLERAALPVSKPYPRVAVPVCAAVTARCA